MKVTFTFILSLPKHALIDMVAHQLSWIRLFLASLKILRSIIIYYIILRFFLQILNEDSVAGPLLYKFLVIPKTYNLRVTFFFFSDSIRSCICRFPGCKNTESYYWDQLILQSVRRGSGMWIWILPFWFITFDVMLNWKVSVTEDCESIRSFGLVFIPSFLLVPVNNIFVTS